MKKNQLEMLAGILGGMGLIYYASKSHSGSMSSASWHFTIADQLLNQTGRNADQAIVIAQQQYGNDLESCQMIKAAIYELAKHARVGFGS